MTEIKICGLTRGEDVDAACELGAAILGFNFVESSPRRVSVSRARELAGRMPAGVARAGVFAGESRDEVLRAVEAVSLDVVQLHRPITADDFTGLGARVVAAVRVEKGVEGLPAPELLTRCRALLWDSSGGRGRAPDWDLLEEVGTLAVHVPIFVAGGLDAQSVGDVIRRFRPDGVDVASGVEIEGSPGIKDRGKLERFFSAVREADSNRG
jgi:phosphoribosylanthranilate isomerase